MILKEMEIRGASETKGDRTFAVIGLWIMRIRNEGGEEDKGQARDQ